MKLFETITYKYISLDHSKGHLGTFHRYDGHLELELLSATQLQSAWLANGIRYVDADGRDVMQHSILAH